MRCNLRRIFIRDLSPEQTDLFHSDFACIAKFPAKSYTKKEQIQSLKPDSQVLLHPKDTLYTLAAITGDEHYLQIYENHKRGMNMTEVAQALYQMGRDDSREELAKKDAIIAEKDLALDMQKAEIERLLTEIRQLRESQKK